MIFRGQMVAVVQRSHYGTGNQQKTPYTHGHN
jgi:hypothetical protein